MSYKLKFIFRFIIMKLFKIDKLFHKILLITLTPFLIFFGMRNMFFPINIFFMMLGVIIIYIGNYSYQKTNEYFYLFELLIIGPLLFIIGYTKNKYIYLKNIASVLGFTFIIYYFKQFVIDSFLRR